MEVLLFLKEQEEKSPSPGQMPQSAFSASKPELPSFAGKKSLRSIIMDSNHSWALDALNKTCTCPWSALPHSS